MTCKLLQIRSNIWDYDWIFHSSSLFLSILNWSKLFISHFWIFVLRKGFDVGSSIFICDRNVKWFENSWWWNVWKLEWWMIGVDQVFLFFEKSWFNVVIYLIAHFYLANENKSKKINKNYKQWGHICNKKNKK